MKFTLKENGFTSAFEYGALSISPQTDFGFRPVQLMVASIAGCSGNLFKKVLEKKRIPYKNIEITCEVKRSEEQVSVIEQMDFTYHVYGENLEETKITKSLELAMKNCAMAQSVNSAIVIREKLELHEV